jgi:hypothetical protein
LNLQSSLRCRFCHFFFGLLSSVHSRLCFRVALQGEILALRHQLLVLAASSRNRRPCLRNSDRSGLLPGPPDPVLYRTTRRVNGNTYAWRVTIIPTKAASAMLWKNT